MRHGPILDRCCTPGLLLTVLVAAGCAPRASAQDPVCTANRYGTPEQALAIERVLQDGDNDAAVAAIRAAQRTRGTELGCAEVAVSYGPADTRAPGAAQVLAAWEVHAASAAQSTQYDRCPALGRAAGAYALGGWVARAGGLRFDRARLAQLSDAFVDTQYLPAQTPGRLPVWPGLYGYGEVLGQPGECDAGPVVGAGVAMVCRDLPTLCPAYGRGRWRGMRFGIGDYLPDAGVRDGGAAFDQGWAGAMMIEAALAAADASERERWRNSAIAAAEWALHEPPVRNHNYTAKAIWLLAAAYDWTGQSRFRAALLDKLERSLLPGVLMDANADGEVDGVPGVRFAALAPNARTPGRMWDAHNALPWYGAMNAWALVEATAALRSRGDSAAAARVRPYALAMLDNLADEVARRGGPPPEGGPGVTQVPYAFALGLWKLADPEGLARPAWECAIWAYWNAGLATSPGDSKTATVAVVALRQSGVSWRSYRQRELLARLPGRPRP